MGGRGVLSVLALLVVETCQLSGVPSAQFGTFDFLELENTAYQVEIATAPVSELQLQESLQAGEVSSLVSGILAQSMVGLVL